MEEAFLERDELFRSYPPAKHAYDLFYLLRKLHSPFNFVVTSNFALLEASFVIVRTYIKRKYQRQKKQVRLSEADIAEIGMGNVRFRLWHTNHGMVIQDNCDISLSERLVTEYGCRPVDANLIATATRSQCKRFITRDNRLKKLLKAFDAIRLVQPQTIEDELRAYARAHAPTVKLPS